MTESTYSASAIGFVVERLDDETLVYDTGTDKVHALARPASTIWDACVAADGAATIADLAATTGVDEATVAEALDGLAAAGLVTASIPGHLDRRSFVRKVGVGVAATAGLALVTTMAAPAPAMAASGPGGGGGSSGGSCDGPECGG